MHYLVIGAGGTGGMIGYKLAKGGQDVTLIARGEHLERIKSEGLKVHTQWDDAVDAVPVKAVTAENCGGPYDVIFVCFKWYSIESALPIIKQAADAHTVIIPILNIYGTGRMLQQKLSDKYILDGCIYVAASKEKPGQIFQFGKILRIVFGPRRGQQKRPVLDAVAAELDACGIEGKLSSHIEEEALEKFCYVSPVGTASLYYGVTAGAFTAPGKEREMLVELMREIGALGEAMGTPLPENIVERNLAIIASLAPDSSTSMQRDVMAGQVSEMDGLVAEVLRMARRFEVPVPAYRKAAEAFENRGWLDGDALQDFRTSAEINQKNVRLEN